MAWSARFIEELAAPVRTPIWIFEAVSAGDAPIGAPVRFSSAPGYGDHLLLGLRGVRVQGQTLSPSTCSTTIGAFTVEIVGDAGALFANITKGTVCLVRLGFSGWAESDFEIVALGQVVNFRRGRALRWDVECRDLFSAARSRLSLTPGELALFYDLDKGATTYLISDYTVGDTTIEEGSASDWFQRETGGVGAVIIDNGSDTPFYLLWDGRTGSLRDVYEPSAEHFGTTRVDAPAGSSVLPSAYLSGHPCDVVRRLLTSGSGTGTYDDYPDAWGIGIPDFFLDHEDIETFRDSVVVPSSGAWSWDLIVTEPVTDGLAWIQGELARAGMFLAMRQGLITVRALQAQGTTTYAYHTNLTITDEDIADVLEWEAFDSDAGDEAAEVEVTTLDESLATETTATDEDPVTLPAEETRAFDLGSRVWSNRGAVRAEVLARVQESALRLPERLRLRLVPLSWAQLAPGDPVFLTTSQISGRLDGGAYDGRGAIVVEVSPDYIGGYVDVALLVYPQTDGAFA
jgi:hypothetical protein